MNKQILKHLRKLYKHVEYYNNMAPFPIYDTLWVMDIKTKIKEMKNTKKDYDNEPVVACRFCKSLHIESDEDDNAHCHKCGSINELIEYKNIFEYNKEQKIKPKY